MSTYTQHIQTILSIVMFEDGHNYYLNQYMIDDINNFKNELNKALQYYSLPMTAEEIIIYEKIQEEEEEEYEEEDGYSSEEQELGNGIK